MARSAQGCELARLCLGVLGGAGKVVPFLPTIQLPKR